MQRLDELKNTIFDKRADVPAEHAMLVGISGIDASGKGYIANRLARQLTAAGRRIALINIDGWLNLPQFRFDSDEPGPHFYQNALRLDEMFDRLVLPLKLDRSVDLTMDFADETATEFRPYQYIFSDIDIILLEGIFLFKRHYDSHFDLRVWIECGFDIALSRAVARGQEGLYPAETNRAYNNTYFPAQLFHFKLDHPQERADVIVKNDRFLPEREKHA